MTNISEIILIIVIIEYITNESAEYTDPRANSQEKRAKSESLKFKPRCMYTVKFFSFNDFIFPARDTTRLD